MTEDEYRKKWKESGPTTIKMIGKFALLHILDLCIWRVAQGFPSWEKDDDTVYRIHCPSKLGTVWEMKKAE